MSLYRRGKKELAYELGVLNGKRQLLDVVMGTWDSSGSAEHVSEQDHELMLDVLAQARRCYALLYQYQVGLSARQRREFGITAISKMLIDQIESLDLVTTAWDAGVAREMSPRGDDS